ncbi:MAG: alanine--glyoxylate aminotransferase family protein [bacterium]
MGKKYYLMSPGPTSVPPEVSLAEAKPILHHRTKDFEAVLGKVNEEIKYLFQTQNDVFTFASSGTGAMESAVANLLCAGDTALVVRGGKFGERWGNICKAYGVNFIPLDIEWGCAVSANEIEAKLKENPNIKAVFTTLCETSTATLMPIKEIGEVVAKTTACLVVDAVSGLGVDEFRMDEWNVDVAAVGSQKGLMIPPGLAFAAVSPRAMAMSKTSTLPKFYFSFAAYKKGLESGEPPYTPPVSLIYALRQALDMIKQETIEKVWQRHAILAQATRAGITALGLRLLSKSPANGLTAAFGPGEDDGGIIVKKYSQLGITVAGGQDHLKGKIFRVAHMGYAEMFDVIMAISALEMILMDIGYKFEIGAGVKAAEEALQKLSG